MGVMAVTLLSASFLLYVFLQHNLEQDMDQSLAAKASDVAANISPSDLPFIFELRNFNAFASADTYLQAIDTQGSVYRTRNLGDTTLPLSKETSAAAQRLQPSHETVFLEGQKLRLYTTPLLFRGTAIGYLQVARLMTAEDALVRLQQLLLVGSAVGVVLAGFVGWLLARASLRPIDAIRQAAHAIGQSRGLEGRVPYRGPTDEVGRLAATFNEMLEHLEEAFVAQRRFVADASHELRTPLTSMRINVDILRKQADGRSTDEAETLDDIASELERLSRLVSGLLDLARADAGQHLERRSADLRSIVGEACDQALVLARGVTLRVVESGPMEILGSPDHLKQLLLILLDNALKYTPQGGTITVGLTAADGWVQLRVADTGIGIAPEDLPHVFERFYRANSARRKPGTGLGLAIAQWIATEHGGRITVESIPGGGSIFTVWLPTTGRVSTVVHA